MLTPVEMQRKELKSGRGYQKKEADEFLSEVFKDYEILYRENMEMKDKLNVLSDGLKYYKDLEKTLQKTLVVAEKSAEETIRIAEKKALSIEKEAKLKAAEMISETANQYEKIQANIKILMQKYESYRIQCKKLINAQMDLLNSEAFVVTFEETQPFELPKSMFYLNSMRSNEKQPPEMEHTEEKSVTEEVKQEEKRPNLGQFPPIVLPMEETSSENDSSIIKTNEAQKKIVEDDPFDNDLFEFLNLSDDE